MPEELVLPLLLDSYGFGAAHFRYLKKRLPRSHPNMVNRLPISDSALHPDLRRTIQQNCNISDACHSGVYSICTLVLKLRNLFKWEHDLEPWQESEAAEVLAWIDRKESDWESINGQAFNLLPVGKQKVDPFATAAINRSLKQSNLFYGAGYGRALKPVFFLTEQIDYFEVEGCPVYILGRELARELSSPFAMLQDNTILIRREMLRYFLYDQITEIRSSGKEALNRSLSRYGLLDQQGNLLNERLPERLDAIVEGEMMAFVYHELGEMQKKSSDRAALRKFIQFFPGSVQEYLARAVQDVLADTSDQGMLGYIVRERRETSLGFYVAWLDGLRQVLFPEIREAARNFFQTGDWEGIRQAVTTGRRHNLKRASLIRQLGRSLNSASTNRIAAEFSEKLLKPLGLSGVPRPDHKKSGKGSFQSPSGYK